MSIKIGEIKCDYDLEFDNRIFRRRAGHMQEVVGVCGTPTRAKLQAADDETLAALLDIEIDTLIWGRINPAGRTKLIVHDEFPPKKKSQPKKSGTKVITEKKKKRRR